jgi:hypothetical protein
LSMISEANATRNGLCLPIFLFSDHDNWFFFAYIMN